jgi:transcriptional regulator with XRE-family HTH domain
MSYLLSKWQDYGRQANPPRRYSSQREFEADWVYSLRRRYRLSQEGLAALASVSVTTVQNWENPTCTKNIADHNQGRLRDIERDLWIKAHVTLLEPCPPYIQALYDLMCASKDQSAQALAEYLVGSMDAGNPERARLLHWAGLAYSISDPRSDKARLYSEAALDALGGGDSRLSAAIENEILGYQFEELLGSPEGPERRDKGLRLMQACERLYDRDRQPAYLWNALEIACRAPLDQAELFRLIARLNQALGEVPVRQRIQMESLYERARSVITAPPAGKVH